MAATEIYDMHFHLDFAADAATLLADARTSGIGALAVSCDVAGYEKACKVVASGGEHGIVAALGLHPWWVVREDFDIAQVELFENLAPDAPAFGEVGLDFSDKHTPAHSHELQLEVFERACRAAGASARAAGVRKPLSVHSVRAADEALDILEATGCLDSCSCIFHWFSGSSPQLRKAVAAGCWFSVNAMGLSSGKGREYAKVIPRDKLLLETDLPPEDAKSFDVAEWRCALENALERLESSTGHDCRVRCAENARALFG